VFALLRRCEEIGAARTIDEEFRWRSELPGFGVQIYPSGDPRFAALRPIIDDLLDPPKGELFASLLELASSFGLPAPNIDMALAALAWSMDADSSVGPLIFSLSRMAGWAAHYIEELSEDPLRFRGRAVYQPSGAIAGAD
jgi:citrate synthase